MNRTALTLISVTFFTLLAVGCSKQEAPQEQIVADTAPVVNCDDASIKNGLVRTLSDTLQQQITAAVATYPDALPLQLERRAWQRLDDIAIDLQNVHYDNNACQAQTIIILPISDVQYADRYYNKVALPSVAERVANQEVSLGADTRFVAPISYQVIDNTITLHNHLTLSTLIADTLTASAYMMAKNDSKAKASRPSTAVVTLEPTAIESEPPPASLDHVHLSELPTNTDKAQSTPTLPTIAKPTTVLPTVQGDDELVIVEIDETY